MTVILAAGLIVSWLAGGVAAAPRAAAARRTAAVDVDGRLDDPGWAAAPITGGFVQRFPEEGAPPSHATEFRVVYDDVAIYIGVRAYDPEPSRIRGLLTRRDQDSPSDWITVALDTYHDRRTAFTFAINPAGVQRDELVFNDAEFDRSWDAVWSGAAAVDDEGWTAELRIPLSQLRFTAAPTQDWGLQIVRSVARTGEQSTWSPWPRAGTQVVSRFGTLTEIDGLAPGRRLEILPYATGGLGYAAVDDADPFHDPVEGRYGVGLDVRYGLSSAFTLAATINPDFGQVEADPSQVNLTANELFFPERRPFFLEGIEVFRYSLQQGDGGGGEGLFYTRRIGASPHLHGCDHAAYCDQPDGTTIYGAAKVSGKTSSGWSVGVLEAVTAREDAALDGGVAASMPVEPLTNYALVRVLKDLRGGRTTVAGIVTAVNRDLPTPELRAALRDQAYTGGVDVSHRFGRDQWNASAKLYGSWVHGAPDKIADDQRQNRHLFQRPDAAHLTYDPTRTSLAGLGALWDVGRVNHPRWNVATGGWLRTPGLELNDMGFQFGADYLMEWVWVGYRDNEPSARVLNWGLNLNAWGGADFQPLFGGAGGNVNGHVTLANQWGFNGGVGIERPTWDVALLRGGPRMRADPALNVWFNAATDGRKAVSGGTSTWFNRRPVGDAWNGGVAGWVTIQARSNVDVSLEPSLFVAYDDRQFVTQIGDPGATTAEGHYVFGRLHQVVGAVTVRAAWTFTPRLSLQLYAQPFVAAGEYRELKEAADTYATDYADRFHVYTRDELREADGVVTVTRGGDTFSFSRPDFNVRELRSNLVVRWEYRPGSTVFLIWSHGRGSFENQGQFRFDQDLRRLADETGEHAVMVKVTYWVGV